MTLPVIGVDPGSRDGACVLLSPRGVVLDWLVWWTRSTGMVVQQQGGQVRPVDDRLAEAVWWWAEGLRNRTPCGYRLVVEGLWAVSGKTSPHSILQLGEACGRVQGVLELRSVDAVRRVRAKVWRAVVLSLPGGMPAEVCEAHAVKQAPHVVEWQRGFPAPWSQREQGGMQKAPRGALAEAACIARWGVVSG